MHDREHQLTAWTEAFPLLARTAFDRALTAVDNNASTAMRALSAEHESWIRSRARGLSLDGLAQVRERAWFAEEARSPPSPRSLSHYVIELALRYLRSAGSSVTLAPPMQLAALVALGAPTDTPSLARRWRLLSLSLPEDLLIAAITVAQATNSEPPSDHVELLPPHAARALADPCAETHVHVSASMSFAQLWAGWIGAGLLSNAIATSRNNDWPLAMDRQSFERTALAAALTRLALAAFVLNEQRGFRSSFAPFARACATRWNDTHPDASSTLAGSFAELSSPGHARLDAYRARRVYRALIAPRPRADHIASHQELDPLHPWLATANASPETRFIAHALRYMLRAPEDQEFAALFWQYTRVRVAIFNFLTLEAGTSGLHWFSTHARRGRVFTDPIDRHLTQFATSLANESLSLGAFEGRTNFPSGGRPAILQITRRFARGAIRTQRQRRAAGSSEPLEIGLVLHFRKDTETRAKPPASGTSYGSKHHHWLRAAWRQAAALDRALTAHPRTLIAIRGIDLCGRELLMPNWPSIGPMRQARRASYAAAVQLRMIEPDWDAAPLAVTVHAGEEYRRLVEGLRRIDELLRFVALESGDRIGHALALADNPERRFPVGSRALQPRIERLDDLLWEHEQYASGAIQAAAGRNVFVQEEILRLARDVYGTDAGAVPVSEHVFARNLRFEPTAIRALDVGISSGFIAPAVCRPQNARGLLLAYLFDPRVYERGEKAIEVVVDAGEAAFALEAQRMLRTTIAHQQITIESNPSCNHLVADLDGIDQHPALALQPLPSQTSKLPPVLLSINTDNPIVFATRLADEYAHIYYALIRAGVSSQEALVWLEQVRSNGYRSRFTVASSADPDKLAVL